MSRSLSDLLHGDDTVVAPGAYDAIGARLVEQAGFPLVYVTGAGVAAARGYPDYGLVTMTEMVDVAGSIADAVSVPVLADADTGFGNELNVTRTVRAYEQRGVAGIHLEDQVHPKRCGLLDGTEVIDRGAYVSRIAAAVEARSSDDFVVVARTDALASLGLDEAIDRANAAIGAGADAAFVEGIGDADALAAIPGLVHGPCVFNLVPSRAPTTDTAEIATHGYRVILCPGLLLGALVAVGDAVLADLSRTGVHPAGGGTPASLFARLGAPEWDAVRERAAARPTARVV